MVSHILKLSPVFGQPLFGYCTVEELLKVVEVKRDSDKFGFLPYKYNRGAEDGVAASTVEAVSNPQTRRVPFLGLFGAVRLKGSNHFKLGDGHSRIEGLRQAAAAGNLTKMERRARVMMMIAHEDDFMNLHKFMNSSITHSTTVKIKTPDYKTNQSVKKVIEAVCGGKPEFDFASNEAKFRSKLLQVYVAYRDASNPKRLSMSDLITGSRIGQLFRHDNELQFPKEVIDALVYTRKVYLAVQKYAAPLQITSMLRKFKSEASLFGYLMVDYLGSKEITTIDPDVLGHRIAFQMNFTRDPAKATDCRFMQSARNTIAQLHRKDVHILALADMNRQLRPNSKSKLAIIEKDYIKANLILSKCAQVAPGTGTPVGTRLKIEREKLVDAYKKCGKYAQVAKKFGVSAPTVRRIITGK